MFKLLKGFHFLGLTLFFGSIAIYIIQGTPMTNPLITGFVRESMLQEIKILTLPGLILMIITGLAMVLTRRELLWSTFFKVKISIAIIILINASFILFLAQQSALAATLLPHSQPILEHLVLREAEIGAMNVILVLFLIFYSVSARKYGNKIHS